MKNLADLKRRLTVGTKLHGVKMTATGTQEDLGVKPISIVQSKQIAFRKDDGQDSWLELPKASELIIHDANKFQIVKSDAQGRALVSMIYTFV